MDPDEGSGKELRPTTRGANPNRPTQAQSIARQRQIALARDVDQRSWADIGQELGMGEKEVRQAYHRYREEIAPIFATESGLDRATNYLEMLAGVRLRLFSIADEADNDSARVGALREVGKCIAREIQLSQSLGLIPKRVDEGAVGEDMRWVVGELARLLRRHGVPPAVIEELRALSAPGPEG